MFVPAEMDRPLRGDGPVLRDDWRILKNRFRENIEIDVKYCQGEGGAKQ
jgi:hypothetical protein